MARRSITVLVFGGRYENSAAVANWLAAHALSEIQAKMGSVHIAKIIHGFAPGADTGGAMWADGEGYACVGYRADWKRLGKAAGPVRNRRMVNEGMPDFAIGFPGGAGTKDMLSVLVDQGIPHYLVLASELATA
ncbi:MAG TPA: SLOG family protein [Asticcacaulis sp.]|nr:SLOG family protein [Asticcacaulis sp.]